MTLVHLRPIDDRDRLSGDAVADERVRLDFDALRSAVRAMAGRLDSLGVGRGDVVAVALPNRVDCHAGLPCRHHMAGSAVLGPDESARRDPLDRLTVSATNN
jgi:acyl-CoA synthetase (AMP-forming)/AMP-acid ligase II